MKAKKPILSALCAFLVATSCANAVLVDAVSVVVDNEPITIYEIFALSKEYEIPTREALEILIKEKLELAQIKTMNIEIEDFVLNQQINDIATKNGMSLQDFYRAIAAQGISLEFYKKELKQKMQRDKLYQYILSSKRQSLNEQEALSYYNKNQKEFIRFESFDVIAFESKNAEDLKNINLTPIAARKSKIFLPVNDNADNTANNLLSELKALNTKLNILTQTIYSVSADPRVAGALTQTDIGTQTTIIQTKNGFVSFLVQTKNNESVFPFEQVKNAIISKVSSDNDVSILKEYFDTLKSRASITIIRLP